MSEETETGAQTLDSSSEAIELKCRQEPEMGTPAKATSVDELTLRSVDERIKQATDPILKRVEELCTLLANRSEAESAGNGEASGSRRNHELSSPSRNRYDSWCKPSQDLTSWISCQVSNTILQDSWIFLPGVLPGNSGIQESYQETREAKIPTRKSRSSEILPVSPRFTENSGQNFRNRGLLARNSRFSRFPEVKRWRSLHTDFVSFSLHCFHIRLNSASHVLKIKN